MLPKTSPLNSCASLALSRMSNKATAARLEGIHSIPFRAWPHECLEAAAIRHVHTIGEKVSQILRDVYKLEHTDRCVRRHFNEYVYVARRFGLIARDRTEQRSMQYPSPPKLAFVSTQRCYRLFASHHVRSLCSIVGKLEACLPAQ